MSENLWMLHDYDVNSTKDIIPFLKEQAAFLSLDTEGNVIAVFTPKRISTMVKTLSGIARVSQQLSGELPIREQGTKDASELYNRACYEFYITDKKRQYELALFDLWLNDSYPITIQNIDSTIRQEAKMEERYKIDSFEEFKSVFTTIIQVNKVRYIIWKLDQLMKEQEVLERDTDQETVSEKVNPEE